MLFQPTPKMEGGWWQEERTKSKFYNYKSSYNFNNKGYIKDVMFYYGRGITAKVQQYDARSSSWSSLSDLHDGYAHGCAVAIGDSGILLTGGKRGSGEYALDEVWYMDLNEASEGWSQMASMNLGRQYHGCARVRKFSTF